MFWSPTMAVQADPARFVRDLAAKVRTASWFQNRRSGWVEFAAKLKQGEVEKEASNAKKAQQPAFGRGKNAVSCGGRGGSEPCGMWLLGW